MADNNSQPKGLEALLQTLSPERREILLFILEDDHRARLGAELVGARAFRVKDTGTSAGWTSSRIWGDITLAEEPPGGSLRKLEKNLLEKASESLQHRARTAYRVRQSAAEKKELEENDKKMDQIQNSFLSGEIDVDKYLARMETNEKRSDGISKKYQEAKFPTKDFRTAAEKLLYKEGVLQPFVVYKKNYGTKGSLFDEMLTLSHELGHVADGWQTEHRADVDAEFSGFAGLSKSKDQREPPFRFGIEDYMYYGHPEKVSKKEIYKLPIGRTEDKIVDEPYARLMDRYNRERLFERSWGSLAQPSRSSEVEKYAYIPNRYALDFRGLDGALSRQDPFATKDYSNVRPRQAAAHPAQSSALMERNRLLGRDPLEGMKAWMKKHGR
jgi:hypothetical protein